MYSYKIKHLLMLVICVMSFSSCDKYFEGVNVDPNNPTTVTPSVLLPSIQASLAYTLGGDATRYTSIMTQHIDGVSRQFAVIQDYGMTGTDVNTMWGNIYAELLQDIRELQGLTPDDTYYLGIAQALEAYAVLMTTDLFGDIPYSEALQGAGNLQPSFDSQESIYSAVQTLLDNAIANFATDGGGLLPGADDLIYGGDADMWTKFCHTLKARAYLHLGGVSASNYSSALSSLANGLTSSADDAKVPFGVNANENSPWYQYNEQRTDCEVGDSYVALMNSLNDARASILGASLTTGHPLFVSDHPQTLLSYTEVKFIEAECRMQTEGQTAATNQAYLDGISSSYSDLGLSSDYAAYVGQASVNPGDSLLTMDEIMTQKYIAMFTDPEVFNDWRRTGIPALTPNTGSAIPTRFAYPDNEIRYNPNAPVGVTQFDKVWWDN